MKIFREELSLDALRAIQNERLKKTVAHAYTNVPQYKKKFKEIELHPDDIQTLDDLHKLPFTTKDDFRENYPYGMFAVPMNKIARIHASSGTTGQPTVVGYTKNDLEIFDEVVARSLYLGGARAGMKMHNAYGYGLFTGGLGIHGGATKLGMAVIPVSTGMTDRQIMLLNEFKPEVICCTPSYAQFLAQECQKRGINTKDLALKYAVLGAEPWTESIRKQVESGLDVKASNIYGLSEIIGPGVSQESVDEQGTGSYIWEDHFFPEVVDRDTGKSLPYGEKGVLVFTTLTKEALPVLRYWTNDICSIEYDKNSKLPFIKMSNIQGRADDMLIVRGVNLFHTQIEEVLFKVDKIVPNYQIHVDRVGNLDTLSVHCEVKEGVSVSDEILIKQLRSELRMKIGISCDVQLVSPYSMPASQGGKVQRIFDTRNIY